MMSKQKQKKIVGHDRQKNFLRRVLANKQKYHHMMIFSGPAHVGKSALAKAFSKHYIDNEEEGVGLCVWEEVEHISKYDDIVYISPQKVEKKGIVKMKKIGIEEVKKAMNRIVRTGTHERRILIVDDAHMLTISAQNALLKIVEEPPHGVMIIFVTQDTTNILATIRSRAMSLSFELCSEKDMSNLQAIYSHLTVDDVGLAPGQPGLAIQIGDQPELRSELEGYYADLQSYRSWSISERMQYAENLAKDRIRCERCLALWIARTRKSAHEHERYDVLQITSRISNTLKIIQSTNSNARIACENMLLHI